MPYKDPAARAARNAAYYAERRAELATRQDAYNKANREEIAARSAARHRANRDAINAARRARYAASHEPPVRQTAEELRLRYVQDASTRRARKRAAFIEAVDPLLVWERDHGICHICSEPADPTDWHLEHVVPLARGGEHSYANTAVSHPRCNRFKGAR